MGGFMVKIDPVVSDQKYPQLQIFVFCIYGMR